jgi:hypothetical protein
MRAELRLFAIGIAIVATVAAIAAAVFLMLFSVYLPR